jgi:hypothetical protein
MDAKLSVTVLAWAEPDWLKASSPPALRVRIMTMLTKIEDIFKGYFILDKRFICFS